MAALTNLFQFIAATKPTGVWETIIFSFHGGINNYAWAVIVFTIVLKVLLSPIDFYNKKMSAKNAEMQKIIQPEIQKLEKIYGNNKQLMNQKTMEVYKKHNYNVTGSCFIMLIYMVVTFFVFFTLFGGLNSMAAYKTRDQYEKLNTEYYSVFNSVYTSEIKDQHNSLYDTTYDNEYELKKSELEFEALLSEEEILTEAERYATEQAELATESYVIIFNNATDLANQAVKDLYPQVKESWLWVNNIWQPDVPWKDSILSYDEFKNIARVTFSDIVDEETKEVLVKAADQEKAYKSEYERVMNPLKASEGGANGYLIIVFMTVGLAVFSQLLAQGKIRFGKKKKEQPDKVPGGKILTFILPIMLGYFAIMYNTVFALYMMVSSIVTIAMSPLFNLILDYFKKKKNKKEDMLKPDYKRK